jgi:hypothetical protein
VGIIRIDWGTAWTWSTSWFGGSNTTLIVSPRGDGHHTTISAAMQAARDGDRIQVHPGTYLESVVLDKKVTIAGHGNPKDIIIEAADAACLVLRTDSGSVHRVTLRARTGTEKQPRPALELTQGQLELVDCILTGEGDVCMVVRGPEALASLRNCTIQDGKGIGLSFADRSKGTLDNCSILRHAQAGVSVQEGAHPVLRKCTIQGNGRAGLHVCKNGMATVEGCDLTQNQGEAWLIEDNCTVHQANNRP